MQHLNVECNNVIVSKENAEYCTLIRFADIDEEVRIPDFYLHPEDEALGADFLFAMSKAIEVQSTFMAAGIFNITEESIELVRDRALSLYIWLHFPENKDKEYAFNEPKGDSFEEVICNGKRIFQLNV